MIKVLFVCLGNICRSPTAHGVFAKLINDRGLGHCIEVDSAGTARWHEGKSPDERSIAAANGRGVDISLLKARQVNLNDFDEYDYIVAMDEDNLQNLQALAPLNCHAEMSLFLRYDDQLNESDVPDPYYGGDDGFNTVLDLVTAASDALLIHILKQHAL